MCLHGNGYCSVPGTGLHFYKQYLISSPQPSEEGTMMPIVCVRTLRYR